MCPLRGQSLESRLAAQCGVSQAERVRVKADSTPLGVVDHVVGAMGFLVSLILGPRLIGALLSALSSALVKRGSFVVIGPVSWQGVSPDWGLLFLIALVGGAAVALDRALRRSNHRALLAPLFVGIFMALLTLVVPPLHDEGSTPIASAIVFGMATSALFSVWWLTALGVARVRRSGLRLGKSQNAG